MAQRSVTEVESHLYVALDRGYVERSQFDALYAQAVETGRLQAPFGSPDGIWIDPDGIVWIQTDISNSSQNRTDRGYDNIGNNAMLAADPETGNSSGS